VSSLLDSPKLFFSWMLGQCLFSHAGVVGFLCLVPSCFFSIEPVFFFPLLCFLGYAILLFPPFEQYREWCFSRYVLFGPNYVRTRCARSLFFASVLFIRTANPSISAVFSFLSSPPLTPTPFFESLPCAQCAVPCVLIIHPYPHQPPSP